MAAPNMSMDQDRTERYILVAVATGDEEAAWDSLDELADLLDTAGGEMVFQSVQKSLKISAKTGEGTEEFYRRISEILRSSRVYIDTVIAYNDTSLVEEIRRSGQIMEERYEEDGIYVKAYVPESLAGRM